MLNNKESFYKNNLNAKRGKQVLISVFNAVLVYIFCVILFGGVFKSIGDVVPNVKTTINEISLKEKEYYKERENAGLLIYKEDKIVEPKDVIEEALKNETKTAIIHYNLEDEYKNYSSFKDNKIVSSLSLINDPVLFYQIAYKTDSSNYETKITKENNYLNFYDEVLVKKDDFILFEPNLNNEQRFLVKENAIILADYYFKQDTYPKAIETKKIAFDILYKTYEKELKDFNDFNLKGKAILDEHKTIHSEYANILIIELLLAYLLSTILVYVLPYLIKKDYDSIASLALKTPICTYKGKQINIFQNLGIFGINLISNMHVLFFVILTIFLNPGLSLHNFGFLNIGILSIFGAVFSLISLLIMLFTKNHQFLDAYSLMLERKVIDEVKVSEDLKNE